MVDYSWGRHLPRDFGLAVGFPQKRIYRYAPEFFDPKMCTHHIISSIVSLIRHHHQTHQVWPELDLAMIAER